jgi:uncharacterized protein
VSRPLPIVRCPQCKRPVEFSPTNPYRPFCGERCKMIDLGAWASEGYSIAGGAAGGEESGETPVDGSKTQ